MNEFFRKLIDLSVASGNKHLSTQTDYIHLKYHALNEDSHLTIPLVENFLYALALFRTKSVENVTKAKGMVEKLLHFQSPQGNFPVYLHEYPECKDNYLSIQLLPPLYWILQNFSQVLGGDLKAKIENALLKLLKYTLNATKDKNLPYFMRVQVAASAFAIGKLLNVNVFLEEGDKQLQEFKSIPKDAFDPKDLSHMIVASQMINPDLSKSFIPNFIEHLSKTWDKKLNAYKGPSSFENQVEFEPESTLYDLFMGCLTSKFSKRALKDAPFHLMASLIQETSDELIDCPNEWEDIIDDKKFMVSTNEKYSFAISEERLSPFKLMWGDLNRLHTLKIEGGNSKNVTFSKKDNTLELLFDLGEVPELEDKEKSREIAFYFDLFDNTSVKIEGLRATTFQLNENVAVEVDGFHFSLKFEIVEGDGQFLGHFMRGNRPSQIANKGKMRFSAFDNQLFLRTIRRPASKACVIKATLFLLSPKRSEDV